ncbi:membrane protein [Lysobacter daejeonensis GH1-9]|uniref:Membrane protein n=1 Tax=Lysobacter daejeonensis GH1-9 TaxID=1385517 RepID=A0A0A0F3P4_9GAMM|nr:membrane protein [Lysobacter daejeonensis GH1-9]
MTPSRPDRHAHEVGTRALLDLMAGGDPGDRLRLGDLLAGLGNRSFGMMLFIATLPAFIPIPGLAGAISGPLVMLVGLQLLVGLRRPWLPRAVAERGPQRSSLVRFRDRLAPWLDRLERLVRPRGEGVLDVRLAGCFTGLLLVLLGLLLSLPIPFTNFLFGAMLLLFALALLERDGWLMLVAWATGLIGIAVFGVLSGSLAGAATRWIDLAI